MKRIFILVLTLVFFMGNMVSYAYAKTNDIHVFVNGKQVQSDVGAMLVEETTMLPFRSILNAIGVNDHQIVWRAESQSIEIRTDKKYIFLVIGSNGAVVDTNMHMLNVAPFIERNRTMIPVRFVSEVLGANVSWDEDSRTVDINTDK